MPNRKRMPYDELPPPNTPQEYLKRRWLLATRKRVFELSKELKKWEPVYTQGMIALKGLETLPDAMPLSEEDKGKVVELVEMLSNPELLRQFPTDAARATALEWELPYYRMVRKTNLFRKLLLEQIRNLGMEKIAEALPTLLAQATDPSNKNAVRAFEQLMRLGMKEEPKAVGAPKAKERSVTVNNITVNTYEQAIKDTLKARVIDEDASH